MKNIGIIGCGNMGEAIVASGRGHFKFCVVEKREDQQKYLRRKYKILISDLSGVAKKCPILLLAVKPQDFDEVLSSLKGFVGCDHVVISMAAGITTKYIEQRLGRIRVVRVMPNLPALVGQAMTAVTRGRYAMPRDVATACQIFNGVGKTIQAKENLIDAITATSGSGPGYVYFLMEQMIAAAQKIGLSEAMATGLVIETFAGSVHLLRTKKEDPKVLRAKVTSKGGTTQAALDVFMKQRTGLIFDKALKAAVVRARQLSRR